MFACCLPGTYLETDFDRSVTRDISIHRSRAEVPDGTKRQTSTPTEQLADMLRQPPRADRGLSPYRHSQIPSGGSGSPEKIPELTGGRYPAYRGDSAQPMSASPQPRQQQQWYRQSREQPRTGKAPAWNAPRRSGSDENVLDPRAVNFTLSALFFCAGMLIFRQFLC